MPQKPGLTWASPASSGRAMAQRRKGLSIRESRPCMGSLLEICLYDTETDLCRQAIEAAFVEVLRLEDLLSPFKPDSELSRINRMAPYGPVEASPEVFSLIPASTFLRTSYPWGFGLDDEFLDEALGVSEARDDA